MTETTKPAAAATTTKRVEAVIVTGAAPTGFVVPPKPSRGRGSAPRYPFDDLARVGDFFGVKNKERRQLASPITNANKRFRNELKNADGSVASTVQEREFYAVDVDAAMAKQLKGSTYEGSSVLVIRSK